MGAEEAGEGGRRERGDLSERKQPSSPHPLPPPPSAPLPLRRPKKGCAWSEIPRLLAIPQNIELLRTFKA